MYKTKKKAKDLLKRIVIGKRALEELIRHAPKKILKIYSSHQNTPFIRWVISQGFTPIYSAKSTLTRLAESDSHQGFLAEVKISTPPGLEKIAIKKADADEFQIIVVCDGVQDPQNFGAILRACNCFGVQAILCAKKASAPISPATTKASVGASELIPVLYSANLMSSLSYLKSVGYQIVVSSLEKQAQSIHASTFTKKIVLILGNEGEGVNKRFMQSSDLHVYIPMFGEIDSLNVSQATAVLLSHLRMYHLVHSNS